MVVMADPVPTRTDAQRMDALDRANEVRVYRAELKKDIAAGRGRTVAQILSAPEPREETWKIAGLLLALPKVGRVKVNKVLQRCRISPSKTVGGLSERQRGELLAVLSAFPSVRGGMVRP